MFGFVIYFYLLYSVPSQSSAVVTGLFFQVVCYCTCPWYNIHPSHLNQISCRCERSVHTTKIRASECFKLRENIFHRVRLILVGDAEVTCSQHDIANEKISNDSSLNRNKMKITLHKMQTVRTVSESNRKLVERGKL